MMLIWDKFRFVYYKFDKIIKQMPDVKKDFNGSKGETGKCQNLRI